MPAGSPLGTGVRVEGARASGIEPTREPSVGGGRRGGRSPALDDEGPGGEGGGGGGGRWGRAGVGSPQQPVGEAEGSPNESGQPVRCDGVRC